MGPNTKLVLTAEARSVLDLALELALDNLTPDAPETARVMRNLRLALVRNRDRYYETERPDV